MATSSCLKCNGTLFEAVPKEPLCADIRMTFIQCADCGAVVGVIPWYNAEHSFNRIEKALKDIGYKLDSCIGLLNSLK